MDGPHVVWQFDFGDSFVEIDGGLTDEDTVTSMASKETLAWGSAQGLKDKQEMGSNGVHRDAQRKSLRLVEELKAFAKTVKADDAEVPVHLLNDRVKAVGLRKLKSRWFRKGLLRDCLTYLASAYGADWEKRPRQGKGGGRTKLDRDQEAITSMLWHSTPTTWFEFNAGSRLVHFCFPEQYRKEA